MAKKKRKRDTKPGTPALEKISDALELPQGGWGATAQIELSGNREAFVEGVLGVLEYDDTRIRLNTGSLVVEFSGAALTISTLQMEQAVIRGEILSLSFST